MPDRVGEVRASGAQLTAGGGDLVAQPGHLLGLPAYDGEQRGALVTTLQDGIGAPKPPEPQVREQGNEQRQHTGGRADQRE